MAFYLRDQHVTNIILDADTLLQLSNIFGERLTQLHNNIPLDAPSVKKAFFTYIIRFDSKGYKVFSFEELMKYFNQAHVVERIIFTIETGEALSTGRNIGAYLELCLDSKDPNRCTLVSSSDDKDWAEASFAATYEILAKCKTKNGVLRSSWTSLGIQLLGTIVIFIISLLTAVKITPHLTIENPFVISFLFILLILSNIWGYLNQTVLFLIAKLFPNIEFIRPKKAQLHWILQAIVGSAAFAIVLYIVSTAFTFLLSIINEVTKAST